MDLNGTVFDVAVIGGGPAGLAAALAASGAGAKTLLIERAPRLGGKLRQQIHDGCGLIRFGERLAGCEYASRYIAMIRESGVAVLTDAAVLSARSEGGLFALTIAMHGEASELCARALVLATGCGEATAERTLDRAELPLGVITAGRAQYEANILGVLPCKRAVISGSGDIALTAARRLALLGVEIEGVYEPKQAAAALPRNIYECLTDFGIPLHTSHTVTALRGETRLTGVTVAAVNGGLRPIAGTERDIACDGLILSAELMPESALAESLGAPLDPRTGGAYCDSSLMTLADGVFVCGSALIASGVADYLSELGEIAGRAAAMYEGRERVRVSVQMGDGFLCAAPQYIDASHTGETALFFRSDRIRSATRVKLMLDGRELYGRSYIGLNPSEMQRITPTIPRLSADSRLELVMKDE